MTEAGRLGLDWYNDAWERLEGGHWAAAVALFWAASVAAARVQNP